MLGREWHAWRKRRERRAELAEALGEAVSLALDLERFRFRYDSNLRAFENYLDDAAEAQWVRDGRKGQSPREQWGELKKRTLDARQQVWHARGFPSCHSEDEPEELEAKRAEIDRLRPLKQTARWKANS